MKIHRIHRIISINEVANFWNLFLVTYANNKDLKEAILAYNPVPLNLLGSKNIDLYMKELLNEQNKKVCLQQEQVSASNN